VIDTFLFQKYLEVLSDILIEIDTHSTQLHLILVGSSNQKNETYTDLGWFTRHVFRLSSLVFMNDP